MRALITFALAAVISANAHGALLLQNWLMLSDPDPSGPFYDNSPGLDYKFGTGDEVPIPGRNPSGHSYYSDFDIAPGFIYSVAGGSWSQIFDTGTGDFIYTTTSQAGTFNCIGCVPEVLDGPFTAGLTSVPGPTPAASVNAGTTIGVQTYSFEVDALVSDGTTFRQTGTSYVLFPGQDAAALFGADIAAHFAEVLTSTALPADPILVFFEQTYVGIAGPSVGFTGQEAGTAYLVSQFVVPVPATLPLLFSGLGLIGLRLRRRARPAG